MPFIVILGASTVGLLVVIGGGVVTTGALDAPFNLLSINCLILERVVLSSDIFSFSCTFHPLKLFELESY